MEASELRQISEKDLLIMLNTYSREYFNFKMQKGFGRLSKPDQMRKVRKDIARINTVLNEIKRQRK